MILLLLISFLDHSKPVPVPEFDATLPQHGDPACYVRVHPEWGRFKKYFGNAKPYFFWEIMGEILEEVGNGVGSPSFGKYRIDDVGAQQYSYRFHVLDTCDRSKIRIHSLFHDMKKKHPDLLNPGSLRDIRIKDGDICPSFYKIRELSPIYYHFVINFETCAYEGTGRPVGDDDLGRSLQSSAPAKVLPTVTLLDDTEHADVKVRGILRFEQVYGPPNYGETPEIDQRHRIGILRLDPPLEVTTREPFEKEWMFSDVQIINWFLSGEEVAERSKHLAEEDCIIVEGKFFFAITGHHYLLGMIDVDSWWKCEENE